MTSTQLLVGMAEIHTLKGSGLFTCLGLGSCIGFCALDPHSNVAGMVHIMLPEAFLDKPVDKPGKFADTGIPALLEELERLGANRSRLVCAMAGGAQVFRFGANVNARLDIGARNTVAVEAFIKKLGLRVIAKDVGGNSGRTLTLDSETGEVKVRSVSQQEKLLCKLR
jgi:chemotaxis protein CheD